MNKTEIVFEIVELTKKISKEYRKELVDHYIFELLSGDYTIEELEELKKDMERQYNDYRLFYDNKNRG